MGLFDKLKKKEDETPTNNAENQVLPENNNIVQSNSINANQTVATPVGIDNNPFVEKVGEVSSNNVVSQEIPNVDNIFNAGPNDLIETVPTQQVDVAVANPNMSSNQGVLNVDPSAIFETQTIEDEITQLVSESVAETGEPTIQPELQNNTDQMISNQTPPAVNEIPNNQVINQALAVEPTIDNQNIPTQPEVKRVVESPTPTNVVENTIPNEQLVENTVVNPQEEANPTNQVPLEQPITGDMNTIPNVSQPEVPVTTNLESQELVSAETQITQPLVEEQVMMEQTNQEIAPTEGTNEPFILEEPEHTEVEYITSDPQGINLTTNEVPQAPVNAEISSFPEQPIVDSQEIAEQPSIEQQTPMEQQPIAVQQPIMDSQVEEVQPTIDNSVIKEPTNIENQPIIENQVLTEEQVLPENQQNIEAQPVIEETKDVATSLDEVEETTLNNNIQEPIVEEEQPEDNLENENQEINLENVQPTEITDDVIIANPEEENDLTNTIEETSEIKDIQSVENYIPPEIAASQNVTEISNEEDIENNEDIIELTNQPVTEEIQGETSGEEEATILERTNELILQSIAEEQELKEEPIENKPLISEEPTFDLPVILGNPEENTPVEKDKVEEDTAPAPLINEEQVELNIDTQASEIPEESSPQEETEEPILPIIAEADIVIPSEIKENQEETEINSSKDEETTFKEQPISTENEPILSSEEIYKEKSTNIDIPNLKKEEEKTTEQIISDEGETVKQPTFDFQPFMNFNAQNVQEQPIDKPTIVESNEQYGTYISESTPTKFCNNCGVMLTDDSSICPSCGEPID